MMKELATMHHHHPEPRVRAFRAFCQQVRATMSPEERRKIKISMYHHGVEVTTADGRQLLASTTLTRARQILARLKVQAAADPR
jgi:hypothetical protein